jgi:DNA-binding beta-propeller fold protein YncE
VKFKVVGRPVRHSQILLLSFTVASTFALGQKSASSVLATEGVPAASAAGFPLAALETRDAKADDLSQSQVPQFEVDANWPNPLPDRWLGGEVGGTCVDAQDHVFILNRDNLTPVEQVSSEPAPPVIEFGSDGNVVNSWGKRITRDDTGTPLNGGQDSLPKRVHSCFVDNQGNIWMGGNGDAVVQEYTHDGKKLLLQIGEHGHFDTSIGTLAGYSMNSSHTLLNRPAAIAVDPSNGDVYIADGYGNRRVAVFDREGHFLRQWGKQGTLADAEAGVGGAFLDTVHCVVMDNAGLVYVCDRKGDRVQVFDKMGSFKRNIWLQRGTGYLSGLDGSAWGIAFSPDAAQKYMYVADGSNEVIWILDHATGQILSGFGLPGHMAGNFTYLHTIAVDSKGNLYTGEVINGRRVQKFRLTGFGPAGKMPEIKAARGANTAAPATVANMPNQ